jgi:hypothetical protein
MIVTATSASPSRSALELPEPLLRLARLGVAVHLRGYPSRSETFRRRPSQASAC